MKERCNLWKGDIPVPSPGSGGFPTPVQRGRRGRESPIKYFRAFRAFRGCNFTRSTLQDGSLAVYWFIRPQTLAPLAELGLSVPRMAAL